MPKFFAVTSRGLDEALYQELSDLGMKGLERKIGGVWFDGNWQSCYLANLKLRTATRILLPVLDFPAYQPEELYNNVFKKHDFTKYLGVHQTFAVDAKVRESAFKDQRFVALKIKDAIVDQFREKFGERPNVDTKFPHVTFQVRVVKNQVSIAVDTSGESLSLRGYRKEQGEAPLREHLAAGLVHLTGWDRKSPLVDLMCGSGTILVEAALMARNISPGTLRKNFSFQHFQTFDEQVWSEALDQSIEGEIEECPPLFGFDISGKVLSFAKTNAARAGVDENIQFKKSPVDLVEAPAEKGTIIVNPPYGERLGDLEQVKDAYRDLGFVLKTRFQGWTCWILSGSEEVTSVLKLKSSRRIQVYNGNLDCRLLRYDIRDNP